MARLLAFLLISMVFLGGCSTLSLSFSSPVLEGSDNTVVFVPQMKLIRGRPRITPGQYSLLPADDLPQGQRGRYHRHQLRGKIISTATADPQTGTLRFSLPVETKPDYASPICLVIFGPEGKVPVRPDESGDKRYLFHNPAWDEAIKRLTVVRNTGDTLLAIREKELHAQGLVDQTFNQLQAYGATSYEGCQKGPATPTPNRGPLIVERDQQEKVAGQVCAAAWRDSIGAAAEKLYAQTNKAEAWEGRDEGQTFMKLGNLKIKIQMEKKELQKIKIAGREGELFSQFEDGVEHFSSKTVECETLVHNSLKEDLQKWEKARDYAVSAPTRYLHQCQAIAKQHQAHSEQLRTLTQEREKAETRLNNMTPKESEEIELQSLDKSFCSS